MYSIYIIMDNNNVIKDYGVCLSDNHMPLENGIKIDTDLDLENISLVDNYKLVNNKLVKLTYEEKESLIPTTAPQVTTDEVLTKELATMKIYNMKKDLVITNALQTIAGLKVEVMNLKGGNA
ncbi:hypothetical protein [Clostridium beijerinckii]|uniref:Uncharacterized protein n=1 Tax=Clostridium beijerinckii TaxID=1520 RepID=A0A1S8SA23_CLOBE|nr:hypothetical protein [Clostridium beijerinckii]NRY59839.1 hypothetical protein [Clostridium beijerinckii]OOM62194.1 hypothetical protein CLBCK_18970 [Clostridium beijerinckii]